MECISYVHGTLGPRPFWSRGCLGGSCEVSTNVGDFINKESCQRSPEFRQPPPVPIVIVWQHGAQRADELVPVANVDCVHILHQRGRNG